MTGKFVAFDTETTGVDVWHGDRPFAFSTCNQDGETHCFEVPVDPFTRKPEPMVGEARQLLEAVLLDDQVVKVMHHAKFDVLMAEAGWGIRTAGVVHDTMIAARVCNSLEPTLRLKDLAFQYCDVGVADQKLLQRMTAQARRIGKTKGWTLGKHLMADYWMPAAAGLDTMVLETYATLDAERTALLWHMYCGAMEADPRLRLTYEAEMALWPEDLLMVRRGVRIDPVRCQQELDSCRRTEGEHLAILQSMLSSGSKFNPNSDCQVIEALREQGIVLTKLTATGQFSVDIDALREHKDHPFVNSLLKIRAAEKGREFFSGYLACAVPDHINPHTTGVGIWCLHPDLNQATAVTGRYGCKNPNLQNVPNALTTRSTEPIQARTPFGPRPGYTWYHPDYEQLEVRIFADVSQERTMLAALEAGRDIHTECANKAWGGADNPAALRAGMFVLHRLAPAEFAACTPEVQKRVLRLTSNSKRDVAEWLSEFDWNIVAAEASLGKKTSRAKAKMILFAKLFGGGPDAIKDLLQCARMEAVEFLGDYDQAFPTISEYQKALTLQAKVDGYIVNRYGRVLRIDPDKAYRCVNYMVQGTAADLLKSSMRRVPAYMRQTGLDAHMVLTIHDELVLEILKNHAYYWLLRGIQQIMEDHEGHLNVAVPVEIKRVRESWVSKETVHLPDPFNPQLPLSKGN